MRIFAIFALAAALCACQPPENKEQADNAASSVQAPPAGCILGENAAIGGPITLTDQSGAAVTQANFQESPTLVYFGYTSCPDVCPLSLQMEKAALAKLGQQGQIIQPVLITLDPARDTPQALEVYVKSGGFPSGLLGLTGTADQVAAAAKAFRVDFQKEDDGGSAGGYTVSHTSFFYLMDEDWRLTAMFPSTLSPADAATCMRLGLKRPENPS